MSASWRIGTYIVTAFLSDDQGVIVLQENGGNPLIRALERYRSKLRRLICEQLEAPERDMVLALLLGEKQTLDPQIKDQIRAPGRCPSSGDFGPAYRHCGRAGLCTGLLRTASLPPAVALC